MNNKVKKRKHRHSWDYVVIDILKYAKVLKKNTGTICRCGKVRPLNNKDGGK